MDPGCHPVGPQKEPLPVTVEHITFMRQQERMSPPLSVQQRFNSIGVCVRQKDHPVP